MLKGGNSNC